MSCLFLDGFDHYATAQITQKWTGSAGGGAGAIVNHDQRTGTQCLQLTSGQGPFLTVPTSTTLIGGTAYKPTAFGGTIIEFATNSLANNQCLVQVNGDGTMAIKLDNNQVFQVPANFILQLGVYARVELKVVFAHSGSFELRLNGATALAMSGVDTDQLNFGGAGVFFIGAPGGGLPVYHDDVYLCDGTGALNNSFMGDIIVLTQVPNADGHYQEWTPLTPGTHFSEVDEIPPDGDTSYVSSSTLNQRDTYIFPSPAGLVLPATILARQTAHFCAKDIAGNRSIAPLLRQGGVDALGNSFAVPLVTYTYMKQAYDSNPCTAAGWVTADLTAMEMGEQVTV
jgi:hypothetical protein